MAITVNLATAERAAQIASHLLKHAREEQDMFQYGKLAYEDAETLQRVFEELPESQTHVCPVRKRVATEVMIGKGHADISTRSKKPDSALPVHHT
jgi:hypothetical protein